MKDKHEINNNIIPRNRKEWDDMLSTEAEECEYCGDMADKEIRDPYLYDYVWACAECDGWIEDCMYLANHYLKHRYIDSGTKTFVKEKLIPAICENDTVENKQDRIMGMLDKLRHDYDVLGRDFYDAFTN